MNGDCVVDHIDYARRENHAFKLLVECNHFGEIGLLYGCERTASVAARSYVTLAILSR